MVCSLTTIYCDSVLMGCYSFDPAINPRKTVCCGQTFCYAHLADWLKLNKDCPSCECTCISPISPSHSSSQLTSVLRCSTTPPRVSAPIKVADVSPSKSPLPTSVYTRLLPIISAVNTIVGEEVGKLLMLIAFILVLCIIAS